ncbi:MAG TPA: hypothetical protein VES65_09370, partial [Solirubrobacteraceae bacterium]|nr:hypothetical protein [Solirubrobacteraceae bacterium]
MSILGDATGRDGRQAAQAPSPPTGSTAAPEGDGRSELRRRRDTLAEQVTELHWDLGGLAYEMAIRDYFRLDVLVRRAALLQERDAELAEVERLLQMEESASVGNCSQCAAPHSRGAVFCWQCGTALMERSSSATAVEDASTAVMDALLAPRAATRPVAAPSEAGAPSQPAAPSLAPRAATRPVAAPSEAGAPSQAGASSGTETRASASGLTLPSGRVSALLVLVFLGFGVIMGGAAGSRVDDTLAASARGAVKLVLPSAASPAASASTQAASSSSSSAEAETTPSSSPEAEPASKGAGGESARAGGKSPPGSGGSGGGGGEGSAGGSGGGGGGG